MRPWLGCRMKCQVCEERNDVVPACEGQKKPADLAGFLFAMPTKQSGLIAHEHPVVLPHVSHFMQVPFRTSEKCPHSPHISPS
jgi:hypothetical protein